MDDGFPVETKEWVGMMEDYWGGTFSELTVSVRWKLPIAGKLLFITPVDSSIVV